MHEEHEQQPDRTTPKQAPERGQSDEGTGTSSSFRSSAVTLLRRIFLLLHRGLGVVRDVFEGDGYSPLDDVRAAFGDLQPRRIGQALIGLVLFAYLLSGIYTVQPGEQAVVRRFGQVVDDQVRAGLHYRLPWPIETETVVDVSQVRRESVGLTEPEPNHPLHLEGPGKLQVLSGDTNIVDYEVIVQYQVSDPAAYLFNVDYPSYQLVRDATRAAVTRISGSTGVDDILTTERQTLQNEIRREVQDILMDYNSGLAVVSINLQKAYPPDEVADAFRDVSSAREDKSKAINDAEAYRNSIVPEARGEANGIVARAESYAQAQVDRATGAAESFEAILNEYRINSRIYGEAVTRFRLYLETMEQVLPRVQVYVVEPGERVNLRFLEGENVTTFPPAPEGE